MKHKLPSAYGTRNALARPRRARAGISTNRSLAHGPNKEEDGGHLAAASAGDGVRTLPPAAGHGLTSEEEGLSGGWRRKRERERISRAAL